MSSEKRTLTVKALEEAGWPSVAEDVAEGLSSNAVLRRLRDIGEEDSEAYVIVGEADLPDADSVW